MPQSWVLGLVLLPFGLGNSLLWGCPEHSGVAISFLGLYSLYARSILTLAVTTKNVPRCGLMSPGYTSRLWGPRDLEAEPLRSVLHVAAAPGCQPDSWIDLLTLAVTDTGAPGR
jgi:hypothetical protein